jgi:hypothetical protein
MGAGKLFQPLPSDIVAEQLWFSGRQRVGNFTPASTPADSNKTQHYANVKGRAHALKFIKRDSAELVSTLMRIDFKISYMAFTRQ